MPDQSNVTACPTCFKGMYMSAQRCSHCGAANPDRKETNTAGASAVAIVVVVGIFLLALFGLRSCLSGSSPESYDTKVRAAAQRACYDVIKLSLKYPSTFDPSYINTQSKVLTGGDVIVKVPFEAKNAFGLEIPQMGYCRVSGGKADLVDITPR